MQAARPENAPRCLKSWTHGRQGDGEARGQRSEVRGQKTGVPILMEGPHQHVPTAYIYLPMGFALMVEMLQMRYEHNRRRMKA